VCGCVAALSHVSLPTALRVSLAFVINDDCRNNLVVFFSAMQCCSCVRESFFNGGVKVKNQVFMQHDTLIFTPPHEIVLIARQVVIATTLTPVRHKGHMQFLQVQILGGSAAPPLTRPS